MTTSVKRRRVDATEGPIFSKMLYFVIPLILTNLIQQLYTIADNLVVGRFSTDAAALGAIGSSGSVVAFLTALFSGFAVGTAATVSHDFGAKNKYTIAITARNIIPLETDKNANTPPATIFTPEYLVFLPQAISSNPSAHSINPASW